MDLNNGNMFMLNFMPYFYKYVKVSADLLIDSLFFIKKIST